ncbi:MAG: hypothetical protein U1F20_01205 [Lysobacterales bacterium]
MRFLEKAQYLQFLQATEIAPDIALSDKEPLGIAMQRMTEEECRFAPDPHAPPADESPVFIVGFPRSGDDHARTDARRRTRAMSRWTRAAPTLQDCIQRMQVLRLRYPQQLGMLGERELQAIRNGYWSEVAKIVEVLSRRDPGGQEPSKPCCACR